MTRLHKKHGSFARLLMTGAALAAVLSGAAPLSAQGKGCFYERTVQERFVLCEGSDGFVWRKGIVMRLPGMYAANDTLAVAGARCDSLIHYEAVLVTYPCAGRADSGAANISWRDPSADDMKTSSVVSTQEGVFVISSKTAVLRPSKPDAPSQEAGDDATLDLSAIDLSSGAVRLTPNPARHGDRIEAKGCGDALLLLYDAEGRLAGKAENASGLAIDPRLPRGTYYVKINSRDGSAWVRKLEIR